MAKIQDGNVYIIMNVASGTVVDLNNGSSASGPPAYIQGFPILLNNPGNLQHQLWDAKLEVSDSSGDWYSFRNHTTQTAIDCGNMSNEGKQLVCYEYHPKFSNQLWQLTPIPNNPIPFYQIYNKTAADQKQEVGFDMAGGSSNPNTPINFWAQGPVGTIANQSWMLIQVDH